MSTEYLHLDSDELRENIQQALNEWNQSSRMDSSLQSLYLYRRLIQENHGDVQQATNRILAQALDQLSLEHAEHADILRSRFVENHKVEFAASQLNISQATFHRKRNEALPLLSEIVLRQEMAERVAYRSRMEQRLELSAAPLILGQDERISDLMILLETTASPWLFALVGMGGIGKTTLADTLSRRLIHSSYYYGIGWVTARQMFFSTGGSLTSKDPPMLSSAILIEKLCNQLLGPQFSQAQRSTEESLRLLEDYLKAYPHFIVIDNLETVSDVETLLPLLRRLANPTKFLLTTRQSLFDEMDIYHLLVPQLEWRDALALIRHEIDKRNIKSAANAKETELFPIYETVGGNPLALRLVVGQLYRHPLAAVLSDLVNAQGSQAEALYTYIYWHAWSQLSPTEQDVLVAMPLVNEQGGNIELLTAMCELDESELRQAVDTLAVLNLIEVRGDLHERRYTIHSLTRAFLHEQVICWQQEFESVAPEELDDTAKEVPVI